MDTKRILHLDGDAFFAAVEVAKNPRLRGMPVVVGSDRSIATALSYEAKARGVRRGMPVWQIRKICPEVVILPTDFHSYGLFSRRMISIVARHVNIIEEYSIDECFADVSEFSLSECNEIMDRIAKEVQDELDITVSLGLAPNKVLAKVASKWQKPRGKTVITVDRINDFLRELSVGKIWGIGSSTVILLNKLGVNTAYDFANLSKAIVSENLSVNHLEIWHELRGDFVMEVKQFSDLPKSISRTSTFRPFTKDSNRLLTEISRHVEDACLAAREIGLFACRCSFFVKSQNFQIRRREIILDIATNSASDIMKVIRRHFFELLSGTDGVFCRASGVTLFELRKAGSVQPDLFGQSVSREDLHSVFGSVDRINNRFGSGTVILASSLGRGAYSFSKEIMEFKPKKWGSLHLGQNIYKSLNIPYMGEVS